MATRKASPNAEDTLRVEANLAFTNWKLSREGKLDLLRQKFPNRREYILERALEEAEDRFLKQYKK